MNGFPETRATDVELHWRASALTSALIICVGVALAGALIFSRWQLIAFAAPLLGVLGSIGWQRPVTRVRVHGEPGFSRCFEDEQAPTHVWVTSESADVAVTLDVAGPNAQVDGMELEILDSLEDPDGDSGQSKRVAASADRWGRYPLRARVEAIARGGLLAGTATVDAADIFVFPVVPPQYATLPRTELPDRLGTHLTRRVGPGVEYADVRPYLPGDQLRTINWAVSARRGRLHVTERLTDRAADVAVLVDLSQQVAGPATTATERAVYGAAQVVQSALQNGDRAGIVGLGGRRPRWLGPNVGRRQFYRVLDAVLGAGSDFETTGGTLAPRAAVPPGAVVVAFSTLLDTQFALALIDLRKRGHRVVAIDVLEGAPFVDEQDPSVVRMWTLQRAAMYRDMAVIGVDVVRWPQETTLDRAIRLVPDRSRRIRSGV